MRTDAVAVTELVIWHHHNGFPKKQWTAAGRLFQARVWREYAQAWDGRPTMTGVGRDWVAGVLRISKAECLRRSRVNIYLARRISRSSLPTPTEKEQR
jgi:hypothetical protein